MCKKLGVFFTVIACGAFLVVAGALAGEKASDPSGMEEMGEMGSMGEMGAAEAMEEEAEESMGQASEAVKETLETEPININSATAVQLATLPGISDTIAQAIITYRDQNGPFQKVEELLQVKDFTAEKLEVVRKLITLSQPDE